MAEGKKSFMFYCDWIDTFKSLSKDDSYELFIHLLEYVNDTNPTSKNPVVNAVFPIIRNQLKRDLKKWETKAEKNRQNALKRWQKNNANACDGMQTMRTDAKNAVIVKDTVTVTVTDKGNVIDILDRKYKFSNTILELVNKEFPEADAETVKEFCDYWTEHGERDKKMRFEKQKSFNNKLRFNRWLKNKKEWKKEKSSAKKEKEQDAFSIIQQVKNGTYGKSSN